MTAKRVKDVVVGIVTFILFILLVLCFLTTGRTQEWLGVTTNGLYETLIFLTLAASVSAGWLVKRMMKRRMERGLGHKVDDIELASIVTWMKMPDEAKKAANDARKYDLDIKE